jgi:hypothetical protein
MMARGWAHGKPERRGSGGFRPLGRLVVARVDALADLERADELRSCGGAAEGLQNATRDCSCRAMGSGVLRRSRETQPNGPGSGKQPALTAANTPGTFALPSHRRDRAPFGPDAAPPRLSPRPRGRVDIVGPDRASPSLPTLVDHRMIPTYSEWLRDTSVALRKRSAEMVAIDQALKKFETTKAPADRAKLKEALFKWKGAQGAKGSDWRNSTRNKKGAITKLDRALDDLAEKNLTQEEKDALAYVAAAQAAALAEQFRGQEVKFKSTTLMGLRQAAMSDWKALKAHGVGALKAGNTVRGVVKKGIDIHGAATTGVKAASAAANSESAASLAGQITSLLKTLCPGKDPAEILSALGLPPPAAFAADVAPFVGALTSGAKAINEWRQVIQLQWQRYQTQKSSYAFAPGDPIAALESVVVLIERDRNQHVAAGSVKTAAFGGKVAGAFLDFGSVTGPVIGVAESLASLLQTIYTYVRDILEVDKANKLLRAGALDLRLFEVCPILGCYFLLVQDHSTIINFAVGDYGKKNFVFDAEKLIKTVDKVLEKARQYVNDARFEIPAYKRSKGVVQAGFLHKGPFNVVLPGQTKPVGQRVDGVIASIKERVAKLRGKPPAVVRPNPKQIVGYGHTASGGFGPSI